MPLIDKMLHVGADQDAVGVEAAQFVARLSAEAISARGRFTVAFSGGSLPKILCKGLVGVPGIDYSKWHVFYADERHVPITHEDSNHLAVETELLAKVGCKTAYTIDASVPVEQSAILYREQLVKVFGECDGGFPEFDLILLGMGPDGHCASLFPGHPLLKEDRAWVAPIEDSPKPPPRRITLTLPVINAAREVAFIAAGAGKKDMLAQVLAEGSVLPCSQVKPRNGAQWFVDAAAAGRS